MTDIVNQSEGSGLHSGVKVDEDHLDGGIFFRHWRAKGVQKAVILLVHGLGEHSGRYQAFADYFCLRGVSVVALDHAGHGASPGMRAHIGSFEEYLRPLDELQELTTQWYPNVPCFLIGHSMGGLIAARYLLGHQSRFTGAALSGAALQTVEPPSVFAMFLARVFSRLVPKMGMLQLDATQISRDPAVVHDYLGDPLVHNGKASARLIVELSQSMELVQRESEKITLPILVMHGSDDAMTSCEGSKVFLEAVSARDKTLKIYKGLYHEIFNEPERLEVLGDLAAWLDARI